MAAQKPLDRFSDIDITKALEYASTKLGFVDGFRVEQAKALTAFLRGHDLFVSLPTGFGKSVIFQAAPFCVDYLRKLQFPDISTPKSMIIVVMPLKSLISDQLNRAKDMDIEAADVTGGVTDHISEGISSGKFSILYASPESLLGDEGRELFDIPALKHRLCGLVIDESHCVTKWGSSSGDTKVFRSAYGKLGEVRSKLRSSVPAVALTATATKKVRHSVAESLGLRNFLLISKSPEKANIKHSFLKTRSKDFDTIFAWLIADLKADGASCKRYIIYCQSRRVVSDLYATFIDLLPPSHHKHFDMFHTNTENDVQQNIIDSFSHEDGSVRVLIATIAYGMGVDVKGVYTTIIFGRCADLDDYIQMSGRIGRDGKPSMAITIQFPGDVAGRAVSASMKDFTKGDRCRREVVREVFGQPSSFQILPHDCCDVCASSCVCKPSGCKDSQNIVEKKLCKALEMLVQPREFPLNIPTPSQRDKLERSLEEYRLNLLKEHPHHNYCGPDLACGFSVSKVNQIVSESTIQLSFESFRSRYAFPSLEMATDVWGILCTTLDRSSVSDQLVALSDEAESDTDDDFSNSDEYQEAVLSVSDSD